MDMKQRIGADLKSAMKERDATRLATLRLINAAIKDMEISQRGQEDSEVAGLDDDKILGIMIKMVKQRRESARAYEEGGRLELAEQENEEIEIIENYLPQKLNDDEVAAAISNAIAEVDATSLRDMGKVMGVLKSRFSGQMDFATVGPKIRDRLA